MITITTAPKIPIQLVKDFGLFIDSLVFVFEYLFVALKHAFVFTCVCASYVIDAVQRVDWKQLATDVNTFREQLSKQFVYAY